MIPETLMPLMKRLSIKRKNDFMQDEIAALKETIQNLQAQIDLLRSELVIEQSKKLTPHQSDLLQPYSPFAQKDTVLPWMQHPAWIVDLEHGTTC
jgi:hypothetical protein